MIGELFVGGPLVARYRGRDKETAERFVRHPFSVLPEARVYRTGDLVRLYPNGELAFVGRHDEQVKVRGFRIELSEVEAHLQAAPGVASAAVAARPDARGGSCLVGHVVVADGSVLDAAALRAYLQQHLPAFMVPSAWIEHEALPLTPNGKIDRRALVQYAPPEPGVGATGNAPSTRSEQLLAEIWQSVLGTMRVGHDDDFFALEGTRCSLRRWSSACERSLVWTFHCVRFSTILPWQRWPLGSSICAAARSGREAPSSSAATVPFPRRSLLGNSVCGLSIC